MLNYACWIIISKALIFNQILSVVNFMLKGRWWTNERSFKSHLGPSGSYLYCQRLKSKLQREILIVMSDTISFFVSSQMIPRSPCISETTRVGPHVPLLWCPMLLLWVLLNCAFNPCCFHASCFVFTTNVWVPDCFLIILDDMWFNQLINLIQPDNPDYNA